jgi:hypothetical protein
MALYDTSLIQEAVSDEYWQNFRRQLKGKPTREKLEALAGYWLLKDHTDCINHSHFGLTNVNKCFVCIRVDNYIKALCRGGQLSPGCDVMWFVNSPSLEWKSRVLK